MAVKETSRKAYHELREADALGKQQRIVLQALRWGDLTRNEVAEVTGLRVSSVCGRVNDLVAIRMADVAGKFPCNVTGRTAERLTITDKGRAYLAAVDQEVA